jgi:hypothetical protein
MALKWWRKPANRKPKVARKQRTQQRGYKPGVEALESRCLFAIGITPQVGFVGFNSGFNVEFRQANFDNGLNDTISQANRLFSLAQTSPRLAADAFDNGVQVINYLDSGGGNLFANPRDVGSETLHVVKGTFQPFGEDDNFAMRASGFLFVPTAGLWTFSVRSDDGEQLLLGAGNSQVTLFHGLSGRSPGTDTGQVMIATPGLYHFQLTWMQQRGGAMAEFFAHGPGQPIDTLVGDPAGTLRVYQSEQLETVGGGTTAPPAADLTVTITPATGSFMEGDMQTYNVTVTNNNAMTDAMGVVMTEVLSPGETFVSKAGQLPTADVSGQTITFTFRGVVGAGVTRKGTITVRFDDEGQLTNTLSLASTNLTTSGDSATATVADTDTLAGAAVSLGTIPEGTTLTGVTVATFTDTNTGNTASDFTATITWEDGTTSVGTVVGANGTFSVQGTHTFPEEGNFTSMIKVTVGEDVADDGNAGQTTAMPVTVNSSAIVTEVDLMATAKTLTNVTEGVSLSAVTVATFTDPGSPDPKGNFSATIDWGDGGTSNGVVSGPNASGVFTVKGSHTYGDEGNHTITVTVNEAGVATPAIATSMVTVLEGDSFTSIPLTLPPTVNQSFTATVATFTDTIASPASDFTATINWGDGTSNGNITPVVNGTTFSVIGTHTYTTVQAFTITVTLQEKSPGSATATAMNTANVTNQLIGFLDANFKPTEGTPFTGTIVTFGAGLFLAFDPNLADYSATIVWGDGTPNTTLTPTANNGNLVVASTHTYNDEGNRNVTVTLSNFFFGLIGTTPPNSTVTVAEGDVLTPGASRILMANEGQVLSNVTVATFTDTLTTSPASDFTATIDWGDGTPTSTVTPLGGGGTFTVVASHTYTNDEGTNPISVTLRENSPGSAMATASASAVIGEGDVLAPVAQAISATEGLAFTNVTVATFSDTLTSSTPDGFSATIDWGDGTTAKADIAPGTVSGGNGTFSVTGNHTYAEEGIFSVTVKLTDLAPGTATSTAMSTATVLDAPLTITRLFTPTPTLGEAFTSEVATFTDANTGAPVSDFMATILWGDGTTSLGAIQGGNGSFSVTASHTYVNDATTAFTVQIVDKPTAGQGVPAATATASGGVVTPLIPFFLGDGGI